MPGSPRSPLRFGPAALAIVAIAVAACDFAEPGEAVQLVYSVEAGDGSDALAVVEARLGAVLGRQAEAALDPSGRIVVTLRDADDADVAKDLVGQRGRFEFALLASDDPGEIRAALEEKRVPSGWRLVPTRDASEPYLLILSEDGGGSSDFAIRLASAGFHPMRDEPVVNFAFDDAGREGFAELTIEHIGERFAVLLDDEVLMAPRIATPIVEGRGFIEASFTLEEAQTLAALMNSGALPARLTLIGERPAP